MNDEELINITMMLDYSQLVMQNVYKIKEVERLKNIINDLLKRIAILEREVEKYEGF